MRTCLLLALILSFGCSKAELSGAKAEVEEVGGSTVDLPAPPKFEVPEAAPGQPRSVKELRLKGGAFLDMKVQVNGVVVWVYDCKTALQTPEMTDAELKRILAEEPERCDRPNFVLAESANDPADKGIQVVDVPRALRPDELKALPKEDVAARQALFKAMPPFQVGDQVVVSGSWKQASPSGFMNSRGLLVYESMQNLTPPAQPAK
jgi:hypothetical protein